MLGATPVQSQLAPGLLYEDELESARPASPGYSCTSSKAISTEDLCVTRRRLSFGSPAAGGALEVDVVKAIPMVVHAALLKMEMSAVPRPKARARRSEKSTIAMARGASADFSSASEPEPERGPSHALCEFERAVRV